jgi:predicted ribonuclease YlaK
MAVLDEALSGLRALAQRWAGNEKFVVADTNFYLLHSAPIGDPGFAEVVTGEDDYHGARLIVPMVVVEELDRAKLGRDELRGRAQVTLAQLDALFTGQRVEATLQPKYLREMGGGVGVPFGGVVAELLFDAPGHVRSSSADNEIIDQALTVRALASRQVTLITYDTHMAMKARKLGLDVLKLTAPPRQPSVRQERRDRQQVKTNEAPDLAQRPEPTPEAAARGSQ